MYFLATFEFARKNQFSVKYRPQTCGDPFWYPNFQKKNPLHFRVYAKTNLKKNLATKTSKTFKLKREKPEIDHFQFKIHTQPKPERQKSGVPEIFGKFGVPKGVSARLWTVHHGFFFFKQTQK